ncbi:MAG: LexA family transcriptional regulator [Clostridia bacterium]|nr:LexA family transcriptional regulator [Clostridia bacterium]
MELLAKNVAALRQRIGLTQKELAHRVGVGETTIMNIESGYLTAPPDRLATNLAEAFGVSIDGLLGEKPLEVDERSRAVYVAESISNEKPFLEVDKIVDTMFIDRDKLRGYEYIGLKVQDNSMYDSRICRGDTALVRLNALIANGDIVVVVCKDSDAIIRAYYKDGNKITLKANGDKRLYPDIVLDEEKDRIIVLGKVINCMINL